MLSAFSYFSRVLTDLWVKYPWLTSPSLLKVYLPLESLRIFSHLLLTAYPSGRVLRILPKKYLQYPTIGSFYLEFIPLFLVFFPPLPSFETPTFSKLWIDADFMSRFCSNLTLRQVLEHQTWV